MSDTDRIANLEWAVRRLTTEVASLRAEVSRLSSTPSRPEPAEPAGARIGGLPPEPPSPRPTIARQPDLPRRFPPPGMDAAAAPARPGLDLERLIGRYGAMGLAALTIMLGVGAFIGWAVEHVQVGPRARIGLGALAAAAVAGLGVRLRARGARSFGNTLLALSLALVHLVAWGAGPSLGVVPVHLALGVAVLASVALAALALRENEQALFVVGLGGSLVAPFVISEASGSVLVLLGYGLIARVAGMHVIRGRRWRAAERVLALGAGAYVASALVWPAGATPEPDALERLSPALFALVCLGSAFAQGGRGGRTVALADAVTLAVALSVLGQVRSVAPYVPWLALAAVVLGYLALGQAEEDEPRWAWALAVPAVLLPVALLALRDPEGPEGALVSLCWAVAAVVAAVVRPGPLREVHALVAGLASALATGQLLSDQPRPQAVALAAHAALAAAIALRTGLRSLVAAGGTSLFFAWVFATDLLLDRPDFAYAPFLTVESAVMAAVTVAAIVVGTFGRRVLSGEQPGERALLGGIGAFVAFTWGRSELSEAFSDETATFLLIVYYAAVGVAALVAGRRSGSVAERRIGLGLAIYGALKALVEAAGISAIALRVGSYLLVGCFLLAVAYWYRGRDRDGAGGLEAPAG